MNEQMLATFAEEKLRFLFLQAIRDNDVAAVAKFIIDGIDVNWIDYQGRSALQIAATNHLKPENEEIIHLLLDAGANLYIPERNACVLHTIIGVQRYNLAYAILQRHFNRKNEWPCNDHGHRTSFVNMLYLHLYIDRTESARLETQNMLTFVLAASGDYEQVPDTSAKNRKIGSITRGHLCAAMQPRALEAAAFRLARHRMAEVAIALAGLDLPALIMVELFEQCCAPPGANLRMHHSWEMATKVKHFPREAR